MSTHMSWTTGGQQLTVEGFGFESGTIDARLDG
jgi:hypothetical protein